MIPLSRLSEQNSSPSLYITGEISLYPEELKGNLVISYELSSWAVEFTINRPGNRTSNMRRNLLIMSEIPGVCRTNLVSEFIPENKLS